MEQLLPDQLKALWQAVDEQQLSVEAFTSEQERLLTAYRQTWEQTHQTSGMRWHDVEPYRRYGYEMAYDPRFQGREWPATESELRTGYRDWSRSHGYSSDESAWDRFKDQAREAWNETRQTVRGRR